MPPAKPPVYIASVRAKRLARSLREHREQAGITHTKAAAHLGWSQGKVSHIERCRNKPSQDDVARMLELYGVPSPEREALIALAGEAERHGWWTEYVGVFNGPYVALEDEASEICDWAPKVVPGLLQTQDYAREVISAGMLNGDDDIERRLQARMARQTILGRPNPPRLHVVLDEHVLERPLGGVNVLRDQLYKLRAEVSRPNVTLQVLPKSVGTHPGLDGAFIVLRFAEDPDVGYVEGFHGAVYLESPPKVANCNVAFERLCRAALDPQESAALIGAAAKQ